MHRQSLALDETTERGKNRCEKLCLEDPNPIGHGSRINQLFWELKLTLEIRCLILTGLKLNLIAAGETANWCTS